MENHHVQQVNQLFLCPIFFIAFVCLPEGKLNLAQKRGRWYNPMFHLYTEQRDPVARIDGVPQHLHCLELYDLYGGFHKWGTPKWMVYMGRSH